MNIKSAFIRKRNDNYNVYIEYVDENGDVKQKSQGKYKSKKEAEKHLIEIKNDINKNKIVICKDITLIDRCYQNIKENEDEWSHNTVRNRLVCIKNHLEPFWGSTLLKDVTILKLQKFVNITFKQFTPAGAKIRYGFLKSVLAECYRLREIPENPCHFIKQPKTEGNFKAGVLTKEETKVLVRNLEGEALEAPILLMVLLGLRYGEACGLRWSDVDFDNDIININQIISYKVGGGFIFKDPKTRGSKRTLHAPKELMVKLKRIRNYQNQFKLQGVLENEYDLVCLNRFLRPFSNPHLKLSFDDLLKRLNFKQIRLHDLRHTNATMMILSGTHMKTVSNRLGHSDIKISMNKYSHVLEEMDKEASNNLSNILFK